MMRYLVGLLRHARRGTLYHRLRVEWARRSRWLRDRFGSFRPADVSKASVDAPPQAGRQIVQVARGVQLELERDDLIAPIIASGVYEAPERRFVRQFLRHGDIFVDVGANIGLYSVIAGRKVGPGGHVYSFEPTSSTYEKLRSNVLRNNLPWVHCYNAGLSDEPAVRSIHMVDGDKAGVFNSLGVPLLKEAVSKSERIKLVTLDQFVEEHRLAGMIHYIKIDVEGWERRVVGGARRTLDRPDAPLLQIEFAEETARGAGSSCSELFHYLLHLGFTMFRIDSSSGFLVLEPRPRQYDYTNLVAAKLPREPQPFWGEFGISPRQMRRYFDTRRGQQRAATREIHEGRAPDRDLATGRQRS